MAKSRAIPAPKALTLEHMFPPVVPAGTAQQVNLGGQSLPLPPVTPSLTLKQRMTPQIGLDMGMDRHG